MKLKVVVVSLLVCVGAALSAQTATAWRYHLPFYKAQSLAKEYTKESCLEDLECVSWAVKCVRVNDQRIICAEATWDESSATEPGEYLRCEWVEKFGIGVGGYISEHFGEPTCGYVYEP